MAEGTYEYECERDDLLGIDPPNRADWEEAERVRKENELAQQMTEIDIQDEKINEGTSKMEEITNILSMTQMRLNKFKGGDGQETSDVNQSDGEQTANDGTGSGGSGAAGTSATDDQQDISQKMSSGLDKLDSLLTKTENAQYAMAYQSKQMKSFLK